MVIGVRVEPELERLDPMTGSARELRPSLRRGTVVTMASPGVYAGKPRPAVVLQADRWLQAHARVNLCPLTSTLMEAPLVRIAVEPSPRNGLRKPSPLMVDKLFTVPLEAVGTVVGQLEPQVLVELDLALRGWLELP
jgi:mRNA interferase MazF